MHTARENFTPPLFTFLNAVIGADPKPPGYAGALCFGVRHQNRVLWWWARSDGRKTTVGTSRSRLADAGLTLLMDAETAAAIFSPEGLPEKPSLLLREGDLRLLKRFTARYVNQQNWLDVRSRALGTKKKTRSLRKTRARRRMS